MNTIQEVIEEFIREHLMTHIVLIALSSAAMLLAMAVDFASGLRKAKQRGEATTSRGLKKTASKATKYFTPYMVLVCIDLISCAIIAWPVFSMLWAGYCVFCEFKSVREKSWQKAEMRKAEKTMRVIVENKDDLAKVATQLIFENGEEKTNQVHRCTLHCGKDHPECCRPA